LEPVRGGLQAHALVRARYPQALCHVVETAPHLQPVAAKALAPAWWRLPVERCGCAL
jgi:malonyl-CoA O-methyltransferase